MKIVLVFLATVSAVVLLGASSASAFEPVEVTVEPDGHHVEDGTEVHFVGEVPSTRIAHIPGVGEVVASGCNDEFHGYVNEDGSGELDDVSMVGTNCVRQACENGGVQIPWPFQIEEDDGELFMELLRCFEPVSGGEHEECELVLPIETELEDPHHYTVSANGEDCFPHTPEVTVEQYGSWELEGRSIEITHL